MKTKFITILMICIILIFLVKCFLDTFNFSWNLDLYHENHIVQKGESSLYEYYEEGYCFTDNEKNMISDRFKNLNVFNNEIFEISECGDIRISFSIRDYNPNGDIYLYSNSNFDDLKKWFESNYYGDKISIYNTWISVFDDEGEIRFYKNEDNQNFRIIYITKLPYRYKTAEIDSYSSFVNFFLKINQNNIA